VELLKKGIVIGMGAHDMSKKQLEDFAKKLHTSKFISKEQAKELVQLIQKRKGQINDHLNARIETFLRNALQKEQLATVSHIDYLEKRIDLLEEEVYNLMLEKYIDEVDDDEIAGLLKDLNLEQDLLPEKKGKKGSKKLEDPLFDEEWLDSDDPFFDHVDLDGSAEELEDLLYLPKEGEVNMMKKKKTVKKAAPKKKAVKKAAPKKAAVKKTVKKAAPKKKVAKKAAVKKAAPKKKVAKKVAVKKAAPKKKATKKKAKK